MRRLRNGAVALAVLVAVYALLGFLVLPLVAKPRAEAALTEASGRQATIGRLEFNPFTLRARVIDFALADREPGRFLARFAALDLDVSAASLRYRAPVFDAVRLSQPRIGLTRNADGTYSFDDLIAKAGAQPEGPSPLFSLNNIEVDGAEVVLDDRTHRKRLVASDIGIGIPFLSSLPHDAEIRVTPRFEGTFDGTRFAMRANATSPFADTREATLDCNLDALPLPKYAEYMALPGGIRLVDGALTPASVTSELMTLIDKAGPFGQGNPQPRFAFAAHRVKFAKVVGEAHVRCTLEAGDGSRLDAVAFRAAAQPLGEALLNSGGMPLHVVGHLRRDTWNGRNRLELAVEDAADPRRQS